MKEEQPKPEQPVVLEHDLGFWVMPPAVAEQLQGEKQPLWSSSTETK